MSLFNEIYDDIDLTNFGVSKVTGSTAGKAVSDTSPTIASPTITGTETAATIAATNVAVTTSLKAPSTAPVATREIGFSGTILQAYQNSVATNYEMADIKQYYFEKDDFITCPVTTPTGPFGFIAGYSGTGASVSQTAGGNTHPGLIDITTGTTNTGQAGIRTDTNSIVFGGGQWTLEWLINIMTLSTGSERFTLRIGFVDSVTTNSVNGVYFRYIDSVNSGKWVLVTSNNSTETATNSTSTPSGATYYKLKIIVNAAGTLATYYVDGSSIGTISTNIPTATGRETGFGAGIIKSVGTTNRDFTADLVQLEHIPTVVR